MTGINLNGPVNQGAGQTQDSQGTATQTPQASSSGENTPRVEQTTDDMRAANDEGGMNKWSKIGCTVGGVAVIGAGVAFTVPVVAATASVAATISAMGYGGAAVGGGAAAAIYPWAAKKPTWGGAAKPIICGVGFGAAAGVFIGGGSVSLGLLGGAAEQLNNQNNQAAENQQNNDQNNDQQVNDQQENRQENQQEEQQAQHSNQQGEQSEDSNKKTSAPSDQAHQSSDSTEQSSKTKSLQQNEHKNKQSVSSEAQTKQSNVELKPPVISSQPVQRELLSGQDESGASEPLNDEVTSSPLNDANGLRSPVSPLTPEVPGNGKGFQGNKPAAPSKPAPVNKPATPPKPKFNMTQDEQKKNALSEELSNFLNNEQKGSAEGQQGALSPKTKADYIENWGDRSDGEELNQEVLDADVEELFNKLQHNKEYYAVRLNEAGFTDREFQELSPEQKLIVLQTINLTNPGVKLDIEAYKESGDPDDLKIHNRKDAIFPGWDFGFNHQPETAFELISDRFSRIHHALKSASIEVQNNLYNVFDQQVFNKMADDVGEDIDAI